MVLSNPSFQLMPRNTNCLLNISSLLCCWSVCPMSLLFALHSTAKGEGSEEGKSHRSITQTCVLSLWFLMLPPFSSSWFLWLVWWEKWQQEGNAELSFSNSSGRATACREITLSLEVQDSWDPLGFQRMCIFHLQISEQQQQEKEPQEGYIPISHHIPKVRASFKSILSLIHDCWEAKITFLFSFFFFKEWIYYNTVLDHKTKIKHF